tara:strand:- start:168 stop:437 length:270 start_codon:yes stop_codon:yes gene_type:complete
MENQITDQSIISLKFMTDKILTDNLCNIGTSTETKDSEILYIKDLQNRLNDDNYKNLTSPDQFRADATTTLYIMNRGIEYMSSVLPNKK